MRPQASNASNLKSILDSDDEFPDSYEDTLDMPGPAYLNDARFDEIQLPWLENCNPIKLPKTTPHNEKDQKPLPTEEPKLIEVEPRVEIFPAAGENSPKIEKVEKHWFEKDAQSKIIISKGVLSTRDIFYIKSIEGYCSESTLIWFIDLLKNKAFPNRHQVSCLASDICNHNYYVAPDIFNPRYLYYHYYFKVFD